MSLSSTFKFFAFLILVLGISSPLLANVNPRNTGKTATEHQLAEDQIQVQDPEHDPKGQEEEVVESNESQEEQRSKNSNSSLNYFFYMIYKVKFENIFKFPDGSSSQNSSGINLININSLIDYFNRPAL